MIGIKKIVNKIRKDKEVEAIILFGSYLKNKKSAKDIDVCVMLDKKYSNYYMGKKRLSILNFSPDKFDINIFQLLPLYVRIKVLKEGRILYLRNTKKIYDAAYKTIKEYDSFKPHYEDYIKVSG